MKRTEVGNKNAEKRIKNQRLIRMVGHVCPEGRGRRIVTSKKKIRNY
jgi:hypothetical protein